MRSAICLTLFVINCTAAEPNKSASGKETNNPDAPAREFIIAVLLQDGVTLRRVTIPTEEKELKWLLAGQKAPPGAHEQIREHFQRLSVKTLKVGDVVELPGNRTLHVTDEMVGPDRAMLQFEGDPLPWRLERVDGQWLVDPRHLIAARKAAAAARLKRRANTGDADSQK